MSATFEPDYRHIVTAAGNQKAARVPLYEHSFGIKVTEGLLGKPIGELLGSPEYPDKVEGYRRIARFCVMHGYDVMPFECLATSLVQGGRALCGHAPAIIHDMAELEAFPWDQMLPRYIAMYDTNFRALAEALPPGMKAVGGVGNGLFETMQDFVPLLELGFLQADDPRAFEQLWAKIGDMFVELWTWFLDHHADAFALCRMGDDLGYRSATMLSPADIRRHIIPQYKRIVSLVHSRDKKFLLHSCGRIFDVMEDIISEVKIDAKHSNEDPIAPFKEWFDRYSDRIALFGGIDMDFLCRADEKAIKERTRDLLKLAENYRGFALGCGNTIADYVPPEKFVAMTEAVREYRGA